MATPPFPSVALNVWCVVAVLLPEALGAEPVLRFVVLGSLESAVEVESFLVVVTGASSLEAVDVGCAALRLLAICFSSGV